MRTIGLLFMLGSSLAFADGGKGGHDLSAAGGIAAPSFSSAVFQNPGGLVYSDRFRATGQIAFGDSFRDPAFRVGLLGGNGSFGIAGGAGIPTGRGGENSLFYGLGVLASGIDTSIGLAGSTGLSDPGGGTSLNAGILIKPEGKFRLGVTAIGIDGGPSEWGAGFLYSLAGDFNLVVDLAASDDFDRWSMQPAILVGGKTASLTLGYGLGLDQSGVSSSQLSDEFSAGASLQLGKSVSWQLYYNQLATWYTAISIDL